MTYPNQGQQWGPPPQQNAAPPQNGGWPQQEQAQQWGPPPQQYGAPQGQGWPQQGQQQQQWGPPQGQQGPPQGGQQWGPPQGGQWQQNGQQEAPKPTIPGTLAGFLEQPSTGGGKPWNFDNVGAAYFGIVNRPLTDGDVEQQWTLGQNSVPATYKDGRAKLVMRVPLNVAPSQDNPDGKAQWYCRGASRDVLAAAQTAVGSPTPGIPEMGCGIYVQFTGTRGGGGGMNPSKVYTVNYYPAEQARQIAAQMGIEYPEPPAIAPQNPPQAPPVPTSAPEQPQADPSLAYAQGQQPQQGPPQMAAAPPQAGPPPQ